MLKTGCFEILLRRSEDDDPGTVEMATRKLYEFSPRRWRRRRRWWYLCFFYLGKEVRVCFQFLNRKHNYGMLTFSYKIIVTIGWRWLSFGNIGLRLWKVICYQQLLYWIFVQPFSFNIINRCSNSCFNKILFRDNRHDIFHIKYQLFIQLYIIDYAKLLFLY